MKTEYIRLFDKITSDLSDDELLQATLRKADKAMEENKRKGIRKPVMVVCAVAAVVALGVTGAAAAGVLRFDELFGKKITAPTEQLANDLMGAASDVDIVCSDENYEVLLKGVTGTENSVLASIGVARRDGKPVCESVNIADFSAWCADSDMSRSIEYSSEVLDDGSVCFTVEYSMDLTGFSENEGLAGKNIVMSFTGLEVSEGAALDFSVEFTYEPSEESLKRLSCTDLSERCTVLFSVSGEEGELPTGRDIPFEVRLTAIDLRAETGIISGCFDLGGYDFEKYVINTFMCRNDVQLIMADGSTMAVSLGGYRYTRDGECVNFTMEVDYKGLFDEAETAVDLSAVTAVSINGTEYPLA